MSIDRYTKFISEQVRKNQVTGLRSQAVVEEQVELDEANSTTYADHTYSDEYDDEHPTYIKAQKAIDALHKAHKENKFKKVKFHTAMGDDSPHAITVHKDSDLHKHPAAKYLKHLDIEE